jgi:opacity protein-like surface antigen
MVKKLTGVLAATVAVASASAAIASDSIGFHIRATVPVSCTVGYNPTGISFTDDTVRLGELREYCNAPNGYDLEVRYTPNSLRGVTVNVGNERVTLDGSGFASIRGATGPKIQTRALSVQFGDDGFDTDEFQVAAIAI